MQASLQVVFERSPTAIEDDGDIRPLGEEESSIVLDDAIRDAVLLARPLKNLCREDCAGLCPSCGTDLNTKHCACQNETVDPRWSALAALREGKEK